MPTAVISGFALGDKIDLSGLNFQNGGSAYIDVNNELIVTAPNQQPYTLKLDQNLSDASILLSADASGNGTIIQLQRGLTINLTYDPTLSSPPAAFKTALNTAVHELESDFSNSVTLNINVQWGGDRWTC